MIILMLSVQLNSISECHWGNRRGCCAAETRGSYVSRGVILKRRPSRACTLTTRVESYKLVQDIRGENSLSIRNISSPQEPADIYNHKVSFIRVFFFNSPISNYLNTGLELHFLFLILTICQPKGKLVWCTADWTETPRGVLSLNIP